MTDADDVARVSRLSLGTHTGTHIDAPAHLLSAGATLDKIPLEILMGPVHVVHLPGEWHIAAADLEHLNLPLDCRRVLFRTRNSDLGLSLRDAFCPNFVAFAPDAGAWLAERGLRLVGLDAPSVDAYDQESLPVHQALLRNGIVIIEGLNLGQVPPGDYDLFCLPLLVAGGDGAPARVVLVSAT